MRQEGPEGRVRFVCDGDMLLKLDREMRQCLVNIDADVSVDLHLEILRALGEHERLVEVENMAYKDSHLGAFRHFLPSLSNTLCQRGELYVNEETKERAAGSHWGDDKKIGRTILDSINWVGGEARVGGRSNEKRSGLERRYRSSTRQAVNVEVSPLKFVTGGYSLHLWMATRTIRRSAVR